MKKMMILALSICLVSVGTAWAGNLVFPDSVKEIAKALSIEETPFEHEGRQYVMTKSGEVYMVVDGQRFRTKGIKRVDSEIVPKAGAHINFDYNSATIKEDSNKVLDMFGTALTEELPEVKIMIEGHTDNAGSAEYNLQLSQDRSEAVKQYLVSNHKIAPERLAVKGTGEGNPIADNETEEGRSMNRRVEFSRVIE